MSRRPPRCRARNPPPAVGMAHNMLDFAPERPGRGWTAGLRAPRTVSTTRRCSTRWRRATSISGSRLIGRHRFSVGGLPESVDFVGVNFITAGSTCDFRARPLRGRLLLPRPARPRPDRSRLGDPSGGPRGGAARPPAPSGVRSSSPRTASRRGTTRCGPISCASTRSSCGTPEARGSISAGTFTGRSSTTSSGSRDSPSLRPLPRSITPRFARAAAAVRRRLCRAGEGIPSRELHAVLTRVCRDFPRISPGAGDPLRMDRKAIAGFPARLLCDFMCTRRIRTGGSRCGRSSTCSARRVMTPIAITDHITDTKGLFGARGADAPPHGDAGGRACLFRGDRPRGAAGLGALSDDRHPGAEITHNAATRHRSCQHPRPRDHGVPFGRPLAAPGPEGDPRRRGAVSVACHPHETSANGSRAPSISGTEEARSRSVHRSLGGGLPRGTSSRPSRAKNSRRSPTGIFTGKSTCTPGRRS